MCIRLIQNMLLTDIGKAAEEKKIEFKMYPGLSKHHTSFIDTHKKEASNHKTGTIESKAKENEQTG